MNKVKSFIIISPTGIVSLHIFIYRQHSRTHMRVRLTHLYLPLTTLFAHVDCYLVFKRIKEHTGHRSLEALNKYKRTGSDQQHEISMALLLLLLIFLLSLVAKKIQIQMVMTFSPLRRRGKQKSLSRLCFHSHRCHIVHSISTFRSSWALLWMDFC